MSTCTQMCFPDVDPAMSLVLPVKFKRRCHVVYLTTPSVVTCQDLKVIVYKWSWRIRMWQGLQTFVWFSWIRVEGWIAGPVCLVFFVVFGGTESNLFYFRWNHFFASVTEVSVIVLLIFCELKVRFCGSFPSLPVHSIPVLTSLSMILSSFHLGFPIFYIYFHINQSVWASHTDFRHIWTVGCQLLSVVSRVKCFYSCLVM